MFGELWSEHLQVEVRVYSQVSCQQLNGRGFSLIKSI